MLWAWVGLFWLWIRNKGSKSFSQLKKENADYEQTGVDILWNVLLGFLFLLFFLGVIYGIYVLLRFIKEAKHFLE